MSLWKFVSIFLLFIAPLQISALFCPNGSFQVPNESVCGFAVTKNEYYHGAVKGCRDRGAVVAKVKNDFENAYLYALINGVLNNQAPYIGVEKASNGNFWVYSDGSQLTYQHWAPDEPKTTNSSNICVVMDPVNALWKTADCTVTRPYFCTLPGNPGPCPYDWIYFSPTKSCYYVQKWINYNWENLYWTYYHSNDAEDKCKSMESNAHLVSIHSKLENDFISDLIATSVNSSGTGVLAYSGWSGTILDWLNYAWIGLHRTGAIGNGYWTDGTPVDYTIVTTPTTADKNWVIGNDASYGFKGWFGNQETTWSYSRFICKMPAKILSKKND